MDKIAMIIGYTVIVALTGICVFFLLARLYSILRKKFYGSRLWWMIYTIKVYRLKTENMINDPSWLLRHKGFIQQNCPKDLLEVWVQKIDMKLEELRDEIKSHGEIPGF